MAQWIQATAGGHQLQSDAATARLAGIDPEEAWKPYRPDGSRPWTLRLAAHLYRRAGFGATWQQLQQALELGPQRAVDLLLEASDRSQDGPFDELESAAARAGSVDSFRAWWLRRLLETPAMLREKMTLFWHHHFATSAARASSAQLFHNYVALLRREALGRFDRLLAEVCRQPAVLVANGAEANRKSRPAMGFARNLLERFSLGPSQFSDDDVREVARAMTGWFVLRNRLQFIPYEHDDGVKRVLGQKGNFGIDEAVRIVLEQQATGRHIAGKLFRWFVSEVAEPSDQLLEPLAARFARDYDIRAAVEMILRSNLFYSMVAYRKKVKNPLEFALSIIRPLEAVVPTVQLGSDLAAAGYDLCRPPTSAGWPVGSYWLSPAGILARERLAARLLSEGGPYDGRIDPQKIAEKHNFAGYHEAQSLLLKLLLAGDVDPAVQRTAVGPSSPVAHAGGLPQRLRAAAIAICCLPEFQLA